MTTIDKITVIGGGSTYTPEFVDGFIQHRDEVSVGEIVLYDINQERLDVVGGLVRRMVEHAGLESKVTLNTDRSAAVEGADFVVSQIRVGGMAARIRDEKVPLQHGIIGQETTGPGGFMKALRTIPATLDIAKDVEKHAPDAWYLNFTNPSGIITETLIKHTPLKVVGLCNNPTNVIRFLAEFLRVKDEEVFLDWIGLNHLAWIRGIYVRGEELLSKALRPPAISQLANSSEFPFDAELIQTLGMFPISYLQYYYYHHRMVEKVKKAGKTKGEKVKEIEGDLIKKYADPKLVTKPPELSQRGGALYSEAAIRLILSLVTDRRDVQILNVKNEGSIKDLPDDVSVEIPCVVGKHGVSPLNCGWLPEVIRPLVLAVKAYEEYTVEAGVTGSREAALKALLVHPLVPSYPVAKALLDEMFEANRDHLPQFFPEG